MNDSLYTWLSGYLDVTLWARYAVKRQLKSDPNILCVGNSKPFWYIFAIIYSVVNQSTRKGLACNYNVWSKWNERMMGALHPRYRHALCALESLRGWKFDGNIQNGNRREDVNVVSRRVDLRQTKSSPNYVLSVGQVPFWTFSADRTNWKWPQGISNQNLSTKITYMGMGYFFTKLEIYTGWQQYLQILNQ